MKLQIEMPTHLIDVNHLGLDRIEPTAEGGLKIGAMVRNTDLAADRTVRRDYAVLSRALLAGARSEEHTSELQSLMRIPYAVVCLNKQNNDELCKQTAHTTER